MTTTTTKKPGRRVGIPLAGRIALWLLFNIVFLLVIGAVLLRGQFRLGLDALLAGRSGERVQTLSELVLSELRGNELDAWNETLEGIAERYGDGIRLAILRPDGQIAAGSLSLPVPDEILAVGRRGPDFNLREDGRPRGGRLRQRNRDGTNDDRSPRRPELAPAPGAPDHAGNPEDEVASRPWFAKKIVRTTAPDVRYWVAVRLPAGPPARFARQPQDGAEKRPDDSRFRLQGGPRNGSGGITLIIESPSLRAGGLLFDYVPWVIGLSVVMLGSVLVWTPLVLGITRALRHMTVGAEAIAQGRLDTRVPDVRSDELGRLGASLNEMAARLKEHFQGQKRFLGDVAHELCTPLARMEMALGVLEQRNASGGDVRSREYLDDVREEVRHMSTLVDELLHFSKADLAQPHAANFADVEIREVIDAAIVREISSLDDSVADKHGQVQVNVVAPENGCLIHANRDLLVRAIGNVLRNSITHGGSTTTTGVIEISAERKKDFVHVTIRDFGPGVEESALSRLFDPFFRPDAARTRESGGTGLGLAIVRSAVEACGGRVTAENHASGEGLVTRIQLPGSGSQA
ncbi:MAG: HAMP domain-containing sensor histidine kinase [Verrucomicrobiales bacterium]